MIKGTSLVVGFLFLFFLSSCSETSWDPGDEQIQNLEKTHFKGSEKCEVCHYKENKDLYNKLVISCNAVGNHVEHGDGVVGGPVPDMEGYIFGPDCELIQDIEECPCFTIDDLAILVGWTGFCDGPQGCLVASRIQLAFQDLTSMSCYFHAYQVTPVDSPTTDGEAAACSKILHEFISSLNPQPTNVPGDVRCNL